MTQENPPRVGPQRYEPRAWGRKAITFGLQNANVALWADPG